MADYPSAVPSLPALPAKSQDDILALFDRLLPDHYLIPLKEPGPGYEYLQAVAAMIARVSEAIAHVGTGNYIGSATGGTYATCTVEIFREDATFGAVTLLGRNEAPQGALVGTQDGYYYELMNSVTFGATELGPKEVAVRAVARGWLWNRPAPFLTTDGEFVAGPINRLVQPIFQEPNFDPTLQVRQKFGVAATGGSANMLDGLGVDRGLPRQFSGIRSITLTRLVVPGTYTIEPGSVFRTEDGFRYKSTSYATLSDATPTPTINVEPLFLNEPANKNPITQVVSLVGATTSQVGVLSSPTPSIEEDIPYRRRLTLLPLTVTPNSFLQLLNTILTPVLQPLNLTWSTREIWDLRYQTAYDFPANQTFTYANTAVPVPAFNGNIFVYDYADPNDPLSNRYMVTNQDRGRIVVALPTTAPVNQPIAPPELVNLYASLPALIDQAKPAGMDVVYVLRQSSP